jgi:NAD(P)-dependent dehydrogenase (short-subunit alcohol dehydrogenase family)
MGAQRGEGSPCGRAVARAFASEGATVVVSDIDKQGLAETVALIRDAGGRAEACPADMRSKNEVEALIGFADRSFGRLDVLVNNASSALFHPDRPLDFWDEIVGVDLLGTLWSTRSAIEVMRRSGGGAIVNFSSTSALAHGRMKGAGSPAYDVAKAGVLRLSTMLGFLGPQNIRVNCIAPDWIAVPHLQKYFDSLTPEQRTANGVPSRLTSLDEIAREVLRLATDENLTGRVLVWWSDDAPKLIVWGDPGYTSL